MDGISTKASQVISLGTTRVRPDYVLMENFAGEHETPMDENLRAQIETYRSRLDHLMRRGSDLRDLLETAPSSSSAMAATRAWQEECGVTVNELSGGSKAHWLARSFSEAFLVRSTGGGAAETVPPGEIVTRLLHVLEQAMSSLAGIVALEASEPPPRRRFDFVHDGELRPVLEQAYAEARRGLEQGDYELALVTACGIMEAIVTDALQHKGLSQLAAADLPEGKIADWTFEARLAVAEKAGLIRGGWVRLPAVGRGYRELADSGEGGTKMAVSELDARRTMQVLHVVMRDLNPGR